MTDKLYEAEVETRQALLNENARLRDEWTETNRKLRIADLKNASSLANNLCPDHRDKQQGKPCLACEIEVQTKKITRLRDRIAELERGEPASDTAISYGPEKQNYPGGPIYRIGTSRGIAVAAPPAQEAPAAPMHYTESGCAYTDSDAAKTIWTCSTDNKACPTTTDGKSLCRQNGVCQRVDMDKLPTVKIEIAAPDDQEQCFYCKQWFPKPVSYHHSWDECIAPDATPETDYATFRSQYGDHVPTDFARTLERQCNALRDKLAEAERDAERYRHMRENAAFQDRDGPMLYWYVPRYNHDLPLGERLDAAIDTAWPERKES